MFPIGVELKICGLVRSFQKMLPLMFALRLDGCFEAWSELKGLGTFKTLEWI